MAQGGEKHGPSRIQKAMSFYRLVSATIVASCTFCVWSIVGCLPKQPDNGAKNVTISFIGWGSESTMEIKKVKALIAEFTAKTGIHVNYIVGPESADDRLALYEKWLGRKSDTPDVLNMDAVWQGLLADDLIDLGPYLGREVKNILPREVQDDTVNGKLVGMPFNLQIGVLYYRRDLLKKYGYSHPPRTWEELSKMALRIQSGERASGNRKFWGFVWQGAAYEGLTCNALEWQASYGGGNIVEKNGVVSVDNPQTIKAFKVAKGWIGTISPPSVLTFMEEDGRNMWDRGDVAFRRDWTWRATPFGKMPEPDQGAVAITLIPQEGKQQAAVLGGESLSVSKYSRHPREAAEFIRYLTSREVQLKLWQEESLLPVIREFYEDPKYFEVRPELQELKSILTAGGTARPSALTGKRYPEVSRAYYTAVHSALAGQTSVDQAVSTLQTTLVRITGFKPSTSKPIPNTRMSPK